MGCRSLRIVRRADGLPAQDIAQYRRTGRHRRNSLDRQHCGSAGRPLRPPLPHPRTGQDYLRHWRICALPHRRARGAWAGAAAHTRLGAGRRKPGPCAGWGRLCGGVCGELGAGGGLFTDWSEIAGFDGPPAIARGLAFVPALAGLACPHWDRAARGGFLGIDLDTSPRDMVRAVLEGIAFRTAEVIDSMAALQPLSSAIRIDGGLSASPAFVQFLADTLARPMVVSAEAELTALGVAALAAQGVGQHLALPETGREVIPEPQPAEWRPRFTAALCAISNYGTLR